MDSGDEDTACMKNAEWMIGLSRFHFEVESKDRICDDVTIKGIRKASKERERVKHRPHGKCHQLSLRHTTNDKR